MDARQTAEQRAATIRDLLVEIDESYHIDLGDLETKAAASGAKFLMLSHMRGHIADMDRITDICRARDIVIIDCPDPDTSEAETAGSNIERLHRLLRQLRCKMYLRLLLMLFRQIVRPLN